MLSTLLLLAAFQEVAPAPAVPMPLDSGREVRVLQRAATPLYGALMRQWQPGDAALFVCPSRWCTDFSSTDVHFVQQPQLLQVAVRDGSQSARGGLIGAVIGLIGGLVISTEAGCDDCNDDGSIAAAPTMMVAGGILGSLIGLTVPRWRAVYAAPPTGP